MDDEKVVLDRKSFEALSVDTRVKILKSLNQRRKTLSEVSEEQSMSVSGIKEHLEILERAELVKKIDDGHKWKYYELTKKGKDIIAPRELKVWILLSMSLVCFVVSAMILFGGSSGMSEPLTKNVPLQAPSPEPSTTAPLVRAVVANSENTSISGVSSLSDQNPESSVLEEKPRLQFENLAIPAVALISFTTLFGCIIILANNRFGFISTKK